MSVICHTNTSVLICHIDWLKRHTIVREDLTVNEPTFNENGSYLEKTFLINTPYIMDGEAKKIALAMNPETVNPKMQKYNMELDRKRKRKSRLKVSQLSEEQKTHLKWVDEELMRMKTTSEFKNYFSYIPSPDNYRENNVHVRVACEKVFRLSCQPFPRVTGRNENSERVIHEIENHRYLILPKCRYVCEDVFNISKVLNQEIFDYVIMDPPWRNKHVRRKKAKGEGQSYSMLSVEEIMKIPLTEILSPTAIVLIWITNSNDITKEFQKTLGLWDLEVVATWFWLKLTRSGEPVVPRSVIQSKAKLPYEKLLVTRRMSVAEIRPSIQDNLLIASIPSAIHSYKPPLHDVLKQYLGLNNDSKCLEVFARSLTPGWTSFGLEVLKFQTIELLC